MVTEMPHGPPLNSTGDHLKPSSTTSNPYLSFPQISEQSIQWLLRTHPDKIWVERKRTKFYLVTYLLTPSHLRLNLTEILSRQIFKASLRKTESILWHLEGKHDFTKICSSDLLLTQSHPWSHLIEISSRQTFKASLRKIGPKMCQLQCKQDFTTIWPGDLLFDPIPPTIALDWDIIKTNIQSKFEEDWAKNVAPTV